MSVGKSNVSVSGSNRNSRSSQLDSSYDNWDSRSSGVRERSVERTAERSSDRVLDRDRYESDRKEHARDSSYDRRGGHGERDRRDNRERGGHYGWEKNRNKT